MLGWGGGGSGVKAWEQGWFMAVGKRWKARTAQLMGEINWRGYWIYNNEASIYEDIGYIIMDIVK